jgi:hypothetical protein
MTFAYPVRVRASPSLSGTLLVLQLGAAAVSLAAIALCPPARGRMILVPIWPGAEQGLAARAIDAGARLVDRGPLPDSLVISGPRSVIAPAMLARGVLVVAAPASGCAKGPK